MAKELSAMELHFLVKEFQKLIDGKIDKIYEKDSSFTIQLFLPGKGKQFLKIDLPGMIFLSKKKDRVEETGKFGLALRKHISNSRIRKVEQKEFERIVQFTLEIKEKKYYLLIELFSPGNVILCNEEQKIILAKKYKGFGSRIIRPNISYKYPKRDIDTLKINESDFVKVIETSTRNSVVITLAVELGLGGLYAEELCLRAGINKKETEISKKDMKQIFKVSKDLIEATPAPCLYYDDNSLIDSAPVPLKKYEPMKRTETDSFSEGLEKVYSSSDKKKAKKPTRYEKEINKLSGIIRSQEAQIKGFENSAAENQEKGEVLYEKYGLLDNLLKEFKKIIKEHPMKEVKEKTKDHDVIKGIDEKNKKISIEIP
ncbi:NFACT family protein [Candidatus Woesearchaeota archaeon]|nr:NFACT family protein [Candidatus Woesearchaeota archaeon]